MSTVFDASTVKEGEWELNESDCYVLTIVLVCFPCFSVGQDVSWMGILCCVSSLSVSVVGLRWFSIRGRC
jgi:hypothetical protein